MADAALVREKLDQAVDVLRELDVDLWLTFVRETTQLSDPCLSLVLGLDLTWSSALMISRTGARVAIVGRFDVENVEQVGGYSTVIGYDQSISEPLRDQLSRLAPRQIAINTSLSDPAADGLTYGMFRRLQSILEGTDFAARLTSAEKVIAAVRGRKSLREIAQIRSAVEATDAIFRRVGRSIQPGLTEREVAQLFRELAFDSGMGLAWGADHCPTVTAGPESRIGHAMPGEHVLRRGQLLQADFGVRKEGFVSDLQRTWYLLNDDESAMPSVIRSAWVAARQALEAGREVLRPGARGWQVDEAARESLTKAGYDEYLHAFGHHIGRTAHDGATVLGPRWERYGDAVEGLVECGNTFAIELGVAVPGYGYIGCEEDVVVTTDGADYLCEPQAELWCL